MMAAYAAMAQKLTFSMLVHTFWSMCDGPNAYVTVIHTFLVTVFKCSIVEVS
jgi:hypothetical protein